MSERSDSTDDGDGAKETNGEYLENNFTIIPQSVKNNQVDNLDDGKTKDEKSSVTSQEILSEEVAVKLSSLNESRVQCGKELVKEDRSDQMNVDIGENATNNLPSELKIEVEEAKISSVYKLENVSSNNLNTLENEK